MSETAARALTTYRRSEDQIMTEDQILEARELLADVSRVQAHARHSMTRANWAMFVLWGFITVGSAVPMLAGADDPGYYWMVAAPIGAVLSFWMGFRHSVDVGMSESPTPYALTAAGMFILTFGGSVLLDVPWVIVWVFSVVAAGFAVMATFDRQWHVVGLAVPLILMFVLLGLTIDDFGALYLSCAFLLGGAMLGLGTGLRMIRP